MTLRRSSEGRSGTCGSQRRSRVPRLPFCLGLLFLGLLRVALDYRVLRAILLVSRALDDEPGLNVQELRNAKEI